MADNYVLRVRQGDDFSIEVAYEDDSGAPINLTGYAFSFWYSVGMVTATKTASPEVTFVPLTGVITLALPSATTSTFLNGRGRYWLKTTAPSVKTLLDGEVEVEFDD